MKPLPSGLPRAVFFDLDGTLLAPGAVLTPRTAAALRRLASHGTMLVLATGGFSERTRLLMRYLRRQTGAGVWAITHNGAAVWDPGESLVRRLSTPLAAVRAALAAAGRRMWMTFETADGGGHTAVYYAGRMRPELIQFVWGPQGQPPETAGEALAVGLEPRWDWRRARSASTLAAAQALGCWCVGTPAALAPLDSQAEGEFLHGARYLPWGSRLPQILGRPRLRLAGRDLGPAEASKGAAAAWLCGQAGIDPAETAAFGDGDNDLELLDFAGLAVAMANATPRAIARARLLAPPNDQDGVAHVLHAWLDGSTPAPAPASALPAAYRP